MWGIFLSMWCSGVLYGVPCSALSKLYTCHFQNYTHLLIWKITSIQQHLSILLRTLPCVPVRFSIYTSSFYVVAEPSALLLNRRIRRFTNFWHNFWLKTVSFRIMVLVVWCEWGIRGDFLLSAFNASIRLQYCRLFVGRVVGIVYWMWIGLRESTECRQFIRINDRETEVVVVGLVAIGWVVNRN